MSTEQRCFPVFVLVVSGEDDVTPDDHKANCVPESSQQKPCLYNAEWSSFPGLKEGQQDRITMVTAVTCSLAGRQSEPPHPTATEGS
ncbi:hypothetical protein CRENBAI_020074 [Crenichthys baileyi]|uniref:Uncharacterized protein n=1 Tax=Crenichthys baileyi TaxID=28760 RepID=A0AAV9RQT5_9TELE